MGELNALLSGLPKEVRGGVLSSAVSASSRPLVSAQKQLALRSERTGALRASIRSKVRNYQNTGTAVAIVGPDRSYYSGGKRVKGGSLIQSDAARPANYAHLVEFGHYTAARSGKFGGMTKGTSRRRGKNTSHDAIFILPKPFVRPSVVLAKSEMASAFDRGTTRGIEKAVSKIKSAVGTK